MFHIPYIIYRCVVHIQPVREAFNFSLCVICVIVQTAVDKITPIQSNLYMNSLTPALRCFYWNFRKELALNAFNTILIFAILIKPEIIQSWKQQTLVDRIKITLQDVIILCKALVSFASLVQFDLRSDRG